MKPLIYHKSRRSRRTREIAQAVKMHVTKGDTVRVISGAFKGKEGKILRVIPREHRVVVEGVNLRKRHRRATQNKEGGIIEFPAPVSASNVMLLDPKSGQPTRVKRRIDKDGTVERIAVKSGQPIPRVR